MGDFPEIFGRFFVPPDEAQGALASPGTAMGTSARRIELCLPPWHEVQDSHCGEGDYSPEQGIQSEVMSNSVTWQDARAVFRLLDELKQLSHEPLAWRRHLLTALSPLVGAQVGLAGEVSAGRFLEPSRHLGCVDTGWGTDSERRAWMRACERSDPELDPSDVAVAQLGVSSYTRSREELVDDRNWYGSMMFNEHYRPALLNHYLLSHLHVPEYRAVHYVFLFKARSEGPFTERERQIVHHLQGELGELWKASSGARLPRRLQQTLALLQAGFSEKEVAEKLVISQGTVHDYCKALHRRWKVRSRAELLARARAFPQAPQLVMQEQGADKV